MKTRLNSKNLRTIKLNKSDYKKRFFFTWYYDPTDRKFGPIHHKFNLFGLLAMTLLTPVAIIMVCGKGIAEVMSDYISNFKYYGSDTISEEKENALRKELGLDN